MIWKILVTLFISLSFLENSNAYIPNAGFIFENLAKTRGSGFYDVQLEVTFQADNQQLVVIENWRVEGDGKFRMTATSKELSLDRLYVNDQIYSRENGTIAKRSFPKEFLEGWFFNRSSASLKKMVLESGVAPRESLSWDPRAFQNKLDKDKSALPQSGVRLSRTRGTVAYAFGKPTPVGELEQSPGLWIEQDKFLVRQIRFNSGSTTVADEYSDYSKNLKFPKTRTVSWKNYTVPIRVISINGINPTPQNSTTGLADFQKTARTSNLKDSPVGEMVQEFYGTFR
jgi:hypothetical protein